METQPFVDGFKETFEDLYELDENIGR